jgi:hypothetical protein
MTTAFILGAGFSKAVAMASGHDMPLTDKLGTLVLERIGNTLHTDAIPKDFTGASFERWLSGLADPQPYLSEVDNAYNYADLLRLTRGIHEVLSEHEAVLQASLMSSQRPYWAEVLLGEISLQQSSILTFNYDSIVERILSSVTTPINPAFDALNSSETLKRFCKLHGSLGWRWDPDNPAGGIHLADGSDMDALSPFIVPPVTTKSAYYRVSRLRELWQRAARSLTEAAHVTIIGYSLPPADLIATNMIQRCLGTSTAGLTVINRTPEDITESLVGAGIERSRIDMPVEGDSAIEMYTQSLLAGNIRARLIERLERTRATSPVLFYDKTLQRQYVSEIVEEDGNLVLEGTAGNTMTAGDLLTSIQQHTGPVCLRGSTEPADMQYLTTGPIQELDPVEGFAVTMMGEHLAFGVST